MSEIRAFNRIRLATFTPKWWEVSDTYTGIIGIVWRKYGIGIMAYSWGFRIMLVWRHIIIMRVDDLQENP